MDDQNQLACGPWRYGSSLWACAAHDNGLRSSPRGAAVSARAVSWLSWRLHKGGRQSRRYHSGADLFLGVLVRPPSTVAAEKVATSLKKNTGLDELLSVAPNTIRKVADIIENAGGRVAGNQIIGPHRPESLLSTKFFHPGSGSTSLAQLNSMDLYAFFR